MTDKQALRPGYFDNLPTLVRAEKAKEKGITEEEEQLYALSQSAGWRILSEYIDGLLRDLDNGTALAMSQGLPFEEIGRNAVVIDLAKGLMRRVVERVDDAREAASGK